jgi:hypothetical protein
MPDDGSLPLWFPFYFVGLWLFVCALLAEISRWTWSEVQYESARHFLWMKLQKLTLGGGITTIRIKHKAPQAFEPFLQTPVPVQP